MTNEPLRPRILGYCASAAETHNECADHLRGEGGEDGYCGLTVVAGIVAAIRVSRIMIVAEHKAADQLISPAIIIARKTSIDTPFNCSEQAFR